MNIHPVSRKESDLTKIIERKEKKDFIKKEAEEPLNIINDSEQEKEEQKILFSDARFVEPMRFIRTPNNQKDKGENLVLAREERSIFPNERSTFQVNEDSKIIDFPKNHFVENIKMDMNTFENRDSGGELLKLKNSSVLFKNLGPQEMEMIYKMKHLKTG
jgi:hypothetical protein